jgi:hypothetical protein
MTHLNLLLVLPIILLIFSWTVSASQLRSRSLRRRNKMDTASKIKSFILEEAVPVASGCVAFYLTLGSSTGIQKMLGISTATKVRARLMGIPSVCAASIAGQRCALLVQEWSRDPQAMRDHKSSLRILSTSSASASREDYYYEIANGIRLPKQDVHTYVITKLIDVTSGIPNESVF